VNQVMAAGDFLVGQAVSFGAKDQGHRSASHGLYQRGHHFFRRTSLAANLFAQACGSGGDEHTIGQSFAEARHNPGLIQDTFTVC
jgi:hypothetical protein